MHRKCLEVTGSSETGHNYLYLSDLLLYIKKVNYLYFNIITYVEILDV